MIFLILTYLAFCAVIFFLFKMCFRKGERVEMFKRALLSFFCLLFSLAGLILAAV